MKRLTKKIPYLIIVGDKEIETETISVRGRGNENLSGVNLQEFVNRLISEVDTKKL